jgi:hypothetical protein
MDNVEIAGQTTSTFDASIIPSGAVVSITGRATDALGCIAEQTITYTRAVSVLNTNTEISSVTGFNDLINIPNTDFIRVYAATAYTCASGTASGSNPVNIFSTPENINTQGYIVYENAATCPLSTNTAAELVVLINNWLSTNGYTGYIDWNDTVPNEFYYSVTEQVGEIERITFAYKLHTSTSASCTSFGISGTKTVTLDLPCQCV